ncbi:MAG: EAL domain-containing protein, partial [Rhodospirillaceae bacterium]|nr:EAL domain-containing protein [Rhodospirillaceae bacterium]
PTEQELARVQAAVAASGDIAYDWDLRTDQIAWSGASHILQRLVGKPIRRGAEFLKRLAPEDMLHRRRLLEAHFKLGALFDCEYRFSDGAGGIIWLHERASARRGKDGTATGITGTIRVITSHKRREAKLRFEANHDRLTGFYNRARLAQALQDVCNFNAKYKQSGAYFAVGVDRLTVINDAFGYESGDAVLIDLSQRLEARPPIGDAIGRVGGDTFGIVVALCSDSELDRVAERILHEMRAMPVETPSGPVFVTASVGATLFSGVEAPLDIMAKAEVALRQAKQNGRDTLSRYRIEDTSRKENQAYVRTAERIQAALREDRFVFAYQPVVSAKDGEVAHYECLLRIVEENGEIRTAAWFMPVVEEMGLVRRIDHKVLEMAVRELRRCPEVTLAINVSAYTTGDKSWMSRLKELVANLPDVARRLIVEITETVALKDLDQSAGFVRDIHGLGARVALDDFGAGYTSFKSLRTLGIDEVKIDGSYVKNLLENPDNQVFVRSLLGLAQGLNLRTVAECVETEAEARWLLGQGVDLFQGYYFGRPDTKPAWRSGSDGKAA